MSSAAPIVTGLTVAVLTTAALLGLTVYSASTAREMDSAQIREHATSTTEEIGKRREFAMNSQGVEQERLRQAEMKALTAQTTRRD